MRAFMKFLFSLIVLALLVAGGAWLWAGRAEGPRIEIRQPEKFIGQATPLDIVVVLAPFQLAAHRRPHLEKRLLRFLVRPFRGGRP